MILYSRPGSERGNVALILGGVSQKGDSVKFLDNLFRTFLKSRQFPNGEVISGASITQP